MNIQSKSMRDARLDRGYSQREVAEGVGMSPVQISNLENGKCYPQHNTRVALQNLLGCHLMFDAPKKPQGRQPKKFTRTK